VSMVSRSAVAATLGSDERYLNRELSWLDFNARVLALASDTNTPLLERVKFSAIFAGNLDEFFEVRVAGLKDQVAAGLDDRSMDGRRPTEQLVQLGQQVAALVADQDRLFREELAPALAKEGIEFVKWHELSVQDTDTLRGVFSEGIFPVLTPLAVDPGHPFPYISNLSLNLAAMIRNPTTQERRFARVKVPPLLPRFVVCQDGRRLVPLEDLIAAHLDTLFPGMTIEGVWPFRVTRNADISFGDEEADDLLAAVETELRRRRFGRAVRLEHDTTMPADVVALLTDELELAPVDVFANSSLLDHTGLWSVVALDRPELKDRPWQGRTPQRISGPEADGDLFAAIRHGDLLVHHPYDSFSSSTLRFIQQAGQDPDVLTIKMTLYRTSGNSPIVQALIDAAERGKQVAVLVEVTARFDEQANIGWARALERAGVHVAYGVLGLKTHTKVSLVVRAESDGLRRYCHVATGNYNSSTARLYEDLGLFSCNGDLGDDLTKLFNSLTGYSQPNIYKQLIVAPVGMRDRIIALIRGEHALGRAPGHIVLKLNSLVDEGVIEALYAAALAGVHIELIVRGICGLRPGVVGLSENIRVRSIVGRFLEHSRIYHFANGDGVGRPVVLIGSADLMERNLDKRIEALVPVNDPNLQEHLHSVLDVLLADDVLSWELGSDGTWHRVVGERVCNAHERFMQLAVERSQPVAN
jgi:polyphosphate kinase